MGVLDGILGFLGKATGLIDDIVTSDEERLTLKAGLIAVQADVVGKALDYEKSLAESRSAIIVAESQADSWLTRSWRPIVMLTFALLIVVGQFGGPQVPTEMWPLLKLGLGGYIVGRSAEKVVPNVVAALKRPEE